MDTTIADTATDLTTAKARLQSLMSAETISTANSASIADSAATTTTSSSSTAATATATTTSSVGSVSLIQAAMGGTTLAPGLTAVTGPDGSTLGIVGDPTSLQAKSSPNPITTTTSPAMAKVDSAIQATSAGVGVANSLIGIVVHAPLSTLAKLIPKSIANFLKNPVLGKTLGAIGVALSAYTAFRDFQKIFSNGFTASSALSLGMDYLGIFTGLLPFMAAGPAALFALGAMAVLALASWIASLFGSKPNTTASAEEKPLIAFPSVWTSGPALYMTSGIALMTMGINLTPTAPLVQTIAVPTVAMTTALNSSGLQDANGNSVSSYSKYGTLFVDKGDGTAADPDKVMIVSPGSSGMDNVSVYTIKSNLQFASPASPGSAYIPILISDGKGNMVPNPQAVQAMQNENALTDAASALSGSAGVSALKNAGTTNKLGTASSGSN